MTELNLTPDDPMLMAYADGELDPLMAKRVERATADDAALCDVVATHRSLRQQVDAAFAPILKIPVPEHLVALIETNVIPMATPRSRIPRSRHWLSGLAVAASLVVGVFVGTQWADDTSPVRARGETLLASGNLARALDSQLASEAGDTRVLVSFRDGSGNYCRVFTASTLDGIACRNGAAWALRQTVASAPRAATAYRQAASGDAALMAAAQDMASGAPLTREEEAKARATGWTSPVGQ